MVKVMKRLCSLGLGSIAGIASLFLVTAPSLAQSRLELETNPPLDEVIPFKQPITLSLKALGDEGLSLQDATVQVKLLTPPKTPWLTTDFPIVEGTTLLDMAIAAPKGEAQVQLMPPVRGRYQLVATVTPRVAGEFEPFSETLDFSVPENPEKYHNLLILLAILGVTGFGGGWVIGGRQNVQEGEIAPQPVRLLLSGAVLVAIATLLYITLTAERAKAHAGHRQTEGARVVESQPHPEALTVSLEDLAVARVGQTIPLSVEIASAATGAPLTDIDLTITTDLLDYDQTVLSFQATPDAQGRYTWKQQFFDGSPHGVTVRVSPQPEAAIQFEPFDLVKRIEVDGVAPPLFVRLISLGYLTACLAAGVGAGFWARRRLSNSVS
jgi:hypothetical protein